MAKEKDKPTDDELLKLKNDPRAGTMKSFIRETVQEWLEEEKAKKEKDDDEKSIFDIVFGK